MLTMSTFTQNQVKPETMFVYYIVKYDQLRKGYNPIRVVQFIYCIVCVGLVSSLLAKNVHKRYYVAMILGTSVAILFFLVTLVDIIAGARRRPIFWRTWMWFSLFATVLYVSAAVRLLVEVDDYYATLLTVTGIFFVLTAILFLTDILLILNMMRKPLNKVDPVQPPPEPRPRPTPKPKPGDEKGDSSDKQDKTDDGSRDKEEGEKKKENGWCSCCYPRREEKEKPKPKPQPLPDDPVGHETDDKGCQCPADSCRYLKNEWGCYECVPEYPWQCPPVEIDHCYDVCDQLTYKQSESQRMIDDHDRHSSYTVVSPCNPVQIGASTSTTGTTINERESVNKSTTTADTPSQRNTSMNINSSKSVTTYGGTFPVGNKDEPPLPTPARMSFARCGPCPTTCPPTCPPKILRDCQRPSIHTGKLCPVPQPEPRKPCSGPGTCYNYECCIQKKYGVPIIRLPTPDRPQKISGPESQLPEPQTPRETPEEVTSHDNNSRDQSQGQTGRGSKSAEDKVNIHRSTMTAGSRTVQICWCGKIHNQASRSSSCKPPPSSLTCQPSQQPGSCQPSCQPCHQQLQASAIFHQSPAPSRASQQESSRQQVQSPQRCHQPSQSSNVMPSTILIREVPPTHSCNSSCLKDHVVQTSETRMIHASQLVCLEQSNGSQPVRKDEVHSA